jgi:hypothetical protein
LRVEEKAEQGTSMKAATSKNAGAAMFLRSVGSLSTDYKVLYFRIQKSSFHLVENFLGKQKVLNYMDSWLMKCLGVYRNYVSENCTSYTPKTLEVLATSMAKVSSGHFYHGEILPGEIEPHSAG